jgi:glycerophosphoryl diester phosphodiesterase
MTQRVVLTGVSRSAAPKVREEAPGLAYLLNAHPGPLQRFTPWGAAALCRTIRACGALGLNVHHRLFSRSLARALAAAGLSASVFAVDSEREMRRMLRLSVDSITTCRVDVLLSMRNGRGD